MINKSLPRITNTETLILGILLNKAGMEIYGWEFIERSEGKLKKGTIYVILNRLEDKGLIESRKETKRDGARGLPRRMYKLTNKGHSVYTAWETLHSSLLEASYA